eukprot:GSMAST32.ASY1.ANO1.2449.1 assembled CDS
MTTKPSDGVRFCDEPVLLKRKEPPNPSAKAKRAAKRFRDGTTKTKDIAILQSTDYFRSNGIPTSPAGTPLIGFNFELKRKMLIKGNHLEPWTISTHDLQNLLKWLLTASLGQMPKWIIAKNIPILSTIVVMTIEDGGDEISSWASSIGKNWDYALHNLPTCSALNLRLKRRNTSDKNIPRLSSSILCVIDKQKLKSIEKLYQSEMAKAALLRREQKQKKKEVMQKLICEAKTCEKEKLRAKLKVSLEYSFPASNFLMTDKQLKENEYPTFKYTKNNVPKIPHGYVSTVQEVDDLSKTTVKKDLSDDTFNFDKIVALDCEMVMTDHGHELARVTVVDWYGNVIYDTYVIPQHTSQKPIAAATTKSEKSPILTTTKSEKSPILTASTIIIGHSLECDFKALHLVHNKVIDTAIIYPHARLGQYKSSLRCIKTHLDRIIQNHGSLGHCSSEDAIAALDLVKKKMKYGSSFGSANGTNKPKMSLCEMIFKPKVISSSNVTSGSSSECLVISSNKCDLKIHKESPARIQECTNDQSTIQYTLKMLQQNNLSTVAVPRFISCCLSGGQSNNSSFTHESSSISSSNFCSQSSKYNEKTKSLAAKIRLVQSKLPPNAFFIVCARKPIPDRTRAVLLLMTNGK